MNGEYVLKVNMMSSSEITGVILAGGRSTRMGQDKGLVPIAGKPLFEHIAQRLSPMVGEIIINTNQNHAQYGREFAIVTDIIQDHSGPLAGMLAGLKSIKTEWALFVPCDVPEFPENLAENLWRHKDGSQSVYARDEVRDHPTFCLLSRSIIPALENFLMNGDRKVMFFFKQINAVPVTFTDKHAFMNLNTPADLTHWETMSGEH